MTLPTEINNIHKTVAEKMSHIHSDTLNMLQQKIFNQYAFLSPDDMRRDIRTFMTDQVVNPINFEIDKMRIYSEENRQFLCQSLVEEIDDLRFHLLDIMTDLARNARIHSEAICEALIEMNDLNNNKDERCINYLSWRNNLKRMNWNL